MLRQLLASPGLLTSSTLALPSAASATGSLLGAVHGLSISILTPSTQQSSNPSNLQLSSGFATKAAGKAQHKSIPAAPVDKRPANTFARFVKDNFASIRSELPAVNGKPAPVTAVAREAAARFKQLSAEELKPLQQQYEAEFAEYQRKKEAKQPPRRRINGYALYIKEHFAKFQQQHPDKKATEIVSMLGQRWSQDLVSAGEKQAYIDRAAKHNAAL